MPRNRWVYIGSAIGTVLFVAILAPYCGRWWRMDKCLDSGGAWDDPTGQCVFKTPAGP
ncbi:hypothetical protein NVS55_33180 [Myxococcus stipitatus]|uniref:hypothetical protein n=1 Tax=Myxococcus stipitatus TaxID=83455 RepID=UPI0031454B0F